jgi:hypothetical protein
LLVLLVACSPAPKAEPDAGVPGLPEGVWEPDPGPSRFPGSLAADGGDVWFSYEIVQGIAPTAWLTKTTSTGEVLHAPTAVAPSFNYGGGLTLAVTESNVVVAYKLLGGGDHASVRVFDRAGVALEPEAHPVVIAGATEETVYQLQVVAAAGGGSRLVATLFDGAHQLGVVELDPAGAPTGRAMAAGVEDGGVHQTVTAATQGDGSLLLAWDRVYDQCLGPAPPAQTFVVATDPLLQPGPVAALHDAPELDDTGPALVTAGGTTYLAWESAANGNEQLALARYPALDAPITIPNTTRAFRPMLALAGPGRGAIAWQSDALYVAPFEQVGADIVVGVPRAVPRVNPAPEVYGALFGLVHVGEDRYVVGWMEETVYPDGHLYATRIDFAEPGAPLAPAAPLRRKRTPAFCD